MAMRQLRVYTEPDLKTRGDFTAVEQRADAVASNRTWLSDFSDDQITISSDLHDVLQAYRHFRRPGA
jgi:hypothetical protein